MGLTVKSLLSGALSGTAQTYAPVAGKGAVIKSILLVNTTGGASTATVQFTNSGGSILNVCPPGISIPPNSSLVLDAEITMSYVNATGDKLSLSGTGSVHFLVSGMERDN